MLAHEDGGESPHGAESARDKDEGLWRRLREQRGHWRMHAQGTRRGAWHGKDKGLNGGAVQEGALSWEIPHRRFDRRKQERGWTDEFSKAAPHTTEDWRGVDEENVYGQRPPRAGGGWV
jgi:hypothetical protein